MDTPVKSKGYWHFELFDPDGSKVSEWDIPNAGTTAGMNDMLTSYFSAGAQRAAWYIGLVATAGFGAFAPSDTMLLHPGWVESQAYSQATRQQWTPLSVSGGSISNTTVASFTVNVNGTQLHGAFLCSDSTKGGTGGQLWATGAFPTDQTLNAGQILTVSYVTTLSG